ELPQPAVGGGDVPAGDRLDRGGEDPVGVARGDPDPGVPDVDREPTSSAHVRPFPYFAVSATRRSTASMASPIAAGFWPPPWATSGLPPPPPPSVLAAVRTRSPALRPWSRAASLVAMTVSGLPLLTVNRATTAARPPWMRPRTSRTSLRRSSGV